MPYMKVLRVSQKSQTLHIVSHMKLTSDRCNTKRNCMNAAVRPAQKLAAATAGTTTTTTTTTTVRLLP